MIERGADDKTGLPPGMMIFRTIRTMMGVTQRASFFSSALAKRGVLYQAVSLNLEPLCTSKEYGVY